MSAKKHTMKRVLILDIPDEVFVEHIFQFVGTKKDLINMEIICKKFQNILQSEYLFRKICLNIWKECFVLHLPSVIFEKYYDSKFKKMFLSGNKFRFHHYGIGGATEFKDPKSIRDYDKKNGSDVENQLLQGTCLDLDYSDYFSKERFDIGDNKVLTLDLIFDEDDFDEYTVQDPCVNIFCALKNPLDPNDKTIDTRFPKYNMVYHYPGDNISGYIYEGNSKKPFMGNGDSNLFSYNYDERKSTQQHNEDDRIKPIYRSFTTIYEAYTEIFESVGGGDLKAGEIWNSLEYTVVENEDRLEYSNTPIFKIDNTNGSKDVLIIHFVDDARRWSSRGSMGGILRNFGDQAKKDYERKIDGKLNQGDCVFSKYPKKKICICSMVVVSMNNTDKERWCGMYSMEYQGITKVKEYCEKNGIKEIHFDRPKTGVLKYYNNRTARKVLNKLVNRDKYRVVFHDREYRGSKDIYKDIAMEL